LAQVRPTFEVGTYEGVPWPIIPSPVWPLPAAPRATEPPPTPATRSAARIVEVLGDVQRDVRDTRYQHASVIRERDGVYLWDCSGMAAWVLRRAAPVAMRRITRPRPVARDFARAIEDAPTTRPARGWQRIERLAEARPGDLFAWRRPRGFPSHNTGHVGFVMDRPLAVPGMRGAYAVRVADATSLAHQDDTRANDEDGGFGIGTLVFLTDESGHGTSYGWFGTASEGYVVTPIVIGRVSR
ncbi:MAG: CHAP domain-containing protein, partial [Sandaracinaceae bacterium]|nr:CHAP domain-containing protein [Sandaracinaceae bacterium]